MPFFGEAKYVSINGGQFTDVGGDWNQWDYSHHVHHENSHNNYAATATNSNNDTSFRRFSSLNGHQQAPSMSSPRHVAQPSSAEEAAVLNHVNNVLGWRYNALNRRQRQSPAAGREGEPSGGQLQADSTFQPMRPQAQFSSSQSAGPSLVSTSVVNPDISPLNPNNSFTPHLMNANPGLPRSSIPHSQEDTDTDSDDSQSDASS